MLYVKWRARFTRLKTRRAKVLTRSRENPRQRRDNVFFFRDDFRGPFSVYDLRRYTSFFFGGNLKTVFSSFSTIRVLYETPEIRPYGCFENKRFAC